MCNVNILERRESLNRNAKAYLIIIYIIGLSILFYAFGKIHRDELFVIVFWIVLAIPFEFKQIIVEKDWHYTLSYAIHLSIVIIYGHWVAIVVACTVSFLIDLYHKRNIAKVFFNICQYSITIFLTGTVFYFLKQSNTILLLPNDLLAFVFASITYAFINTPLVSIIVSLTTHRNLFYLLKKDFRIVGVFFIYLAPISILMVLLYKEHPFTMTLIVPPLAFAYISFNNYISLRNETRKTIEILADFVDRRDHYTAEHSKRVSQYASLIAEQLCLDEHNKELIELAGRVHDLGKVSISDSILLKPSVLSDKEVKMIRTHPEVAYHILEPLNMYKKGSIIVRQHHEKYDGSGYPQGLKEKDIHIGARIIAVADAFDAMTTDRPYRKALTEDEALKELKTNSGSQFDPKVVEAFIEVLRQTNGPEDK